MPPSQAAQSLPRTLYALLTALAAATTGGLAVAIASATWGTPAYVAGGAVTVAVLSYQPVTVLFRGRARTFTVAEAAIAAMAVLVPPGGLMLAGIAGVAAAELAHAERSPVKRIAHGLAGAAAAVAAAALAARANLFEQTDRWALVAGIAVVFALLRLALETAATSLGPWPAEPGVAVDGEAVLVRVTVAVAAGAAGIAASFAAVGGPAHVAFALGAPALLVLGGRAAQVAAGDRRRLDGLLKVTTDVKAAPSVDAVARIIAESALTLLRTPRRVMVTGDRPRIEDCAAKLADNPPWWLVARRQPGSDPWDADDRQVIDALAAIGGAALESLGSSVELRKLATTDTLTGLPNRRTFNGALHATFAAGTPFAVAMLDLDRFKQVNDTLGHHAGDELLVAVARRLRSSVRAADLPARLGGDELAVLLPGCGAGEVGQVAAKIAAAFAAPLVLEGREVGMSPSIGTACWPGDGASPDELLQCADMRMYEAKAEGKRRRGNESIFLDERAPADDGR